MTGQLLIKETQLQRIIRKTGRKPCECKCSLCRMQCHTPCLGTPQDIERLIDAGYADRLAPTLWGAGIIMGVIDIPIPMIQAVAGDEYCIFYHNGLCELHDKGLKPTEGRLSHHSTRRCVKMRTFFFYAQSPDFHKQGLCYYLKILYL